MVPMRSGLLGLLLLAVSPGWVGGHPLSQGALDVVVHPDKVLVRARVTVEEVTVTNGATTPNAPPGPWAAVGSAAYEQHAAYLAQHLHVIADGTALVGGVVSATPPDAPEPSQMGHAVYELEFGPLKPIPPPGRVEVRSDVLADPMAGGARWEATYVVRIGQVGWTPSEGLLLTGSHPITFACDWRPGAAAQNSAAHVQAGRLFGAYFAH